MFPRAKQGKKVGKKLAGRKSKPAWDSTTRDLTVHKLSKEEQDLRRCRIQSKNAEKAKRELQEGGRENKRTAGVKQSNASKSPLPGKEFHSLLAQSDRAIGVVKDLFRDDPMCYVGKPNVTVAPHVTADKAALQRTLIEGLGDGPAPSADNSPGGIRDESVLGLAPAKRALNDLSPSSDISINESGLEESTLHGLDTSSPQPSTSLYQPMLDLHRFQRVVEQEEEAKRGRLQDEASQISSITNAGSERGNATVDSQASSDLRTVRREVGMTVPGQQDQISLTPFTHKPPPHPLQFTHRMPPNSATLPQQCPSLSSTPQNRMGKFASVKTGANSQRSNTGIHDDLSILQELVLNLEQELEDFEKTFEFSFPVHKPPIAQGGAFSSLTASLLASVTKLTHYLKQSQVQLKGEVAVRGQLLQAMTEQQNLMDTLTTDVVRVQEENLSLRTSLQQLQEETNQRMKAFEESVVEVSAKLASLEQSRPVSPPITAPDARTLPVSIAAHVDATSTASVVPTTSIGMAQATLPTHSLAIPRDENFPLLFPSVTKTAPNLTAYHPLSDHLDLLPRGNVSTQQPLLPQLSPLAPTALAPGPPPTVVPPSPVGPSLIGQSVVGASVLGTSVLETSVLGPSVAPSSVSMCVAMFPSSYPTPPATVITQNELQTYPTFTSLSGLAISPTSKLPPFSRDLSHLVPASSNLPTPTFEHSALGHPPLMPIDQWLASLAPLPSANRGVFATPTTPINVVQLSPPVISPSNLAPSPPPLGIALQVPSEPLHMPNSSDSEASFPLSLPLPKQTSSQRLSLNPTSLFSPSIAPCTTVSSHSFMPLNFPQTTLVPSSAALSRSSLNSGSGTTRAELTVNSGADIETSLARMSSLAKSVLEELAQDRGQLPRRHEPTTPTKQCHSSSSTLPESMSTVAETPEGSVDNNPHLHSSVTEW